MTASDGALRALNTHLSDLLVQHGLDLDDFGPDEPGLESAMDQFNGLDLLGADEDTARTFLPADIVARLADLTFTVTALRRFHRGEQRTVGAVTIDIYRPWVRSHETRYFVDDDAGKVETFDLLGLGVTTCPA